MTEQLIKRLESYRKQNKLTRYALCKLLGVYPLTYRRWKESGNITKAYKRLITNFLSQKYPSTSGGPEGKKTDPRSLCSDIAVIGIGCYYPGASSVRELWENIVSRRVQFRRMLDQRLPLSDYYSEDPKFPDTTYLTKAAFIENFQFDWGKLRIPKKTVESTDIAHWLALDIALKTFEDAGYKLSEIPLQNTGVIVGNTLTGEQTRSQTLRLRWPYFRKVFNTTAVHLGMGTAERGRFETEMEQIFKSAFYPVTEDSLAGGLANTIAGRICNYLNLKGGGYIVDGACSSSLLAVATAADALKMGNMDLALAGGVDISMDPFELVGFAKAGALAKDQMRVYDQRAAGFLPGEGCGFVLLKRLNDAIRDKNYVYATIKGWGISSDGKGGIMEPSSSGQSFAIGRAYKDLPYKISDVDFVEGHGTGTIKGDKVELEGISSAIENSISGVRKDNHSCGVTSFKSIVGHTKAAAGVGGLIKAVLAVNQHVLPPTASCTEPNEVFQDKAKFLYPIIHGGLIDSNKVARAGISSAGFGGINCHITIESKDKPKESLKTKIDERALFVSQQQTEVFVFSSRTTLHLKKIIQRFKEDLRNISIAEMADLAALLNKKTHKRFPFRVAIVADSPEHLYEALILLEQEVDVIQLKEGQIYKLTTKSPNSYIVLSNVAKKSRIGFLFPGQGSQRINMARVLVERFSWARDLLSMSKIPLYDYIYKATDKFINKEDQQVFEKQLTNTKITQPAIILSSLIWSEFLSRLGVEPECVAGHSLGELIAFYKAGAFDKHTLIKFAELRGALMAQKGSGNTGMASLLCSKQKAEELITKISGNIIVANINSPSQIVVSGGNKEIGKALELAGKEGISARRLNVSNAFHSSFMKEASNRVKTNKVLPVSYSPNSVGIYSGMVGALLDKKIELREYFSRQVISPVNFVGAIESISKNCDVLIEVGPGRVLTDLAKAINKEEGPLCIPIESSPQSDRDLNIVLAELFVRSVPIRWEQLYQNRMIKVFVPASRKKFIENQCERPLRLGSQVLKSESLRTLSKEELGLSTEEIIPGGMQSVEDKDNIFDLLVKLIHDIRGFDEDSISLGSRLLDDLNLDSIKAADIISQAARTLGVGGQMDPSKLSNNTLGEIRNRLFELAQARLGASAQANGDGVLKRYQDKTWVRNFVQEFKNEEISTRNVNQLKGLKNIVILSEKSEDDFANTLSKEFSKGKAQKINYGEKPKVAKNDSIDCVINILPKGREKENFNTEYLKEIIVRAHQLVGVAASDKLSKDCFVVLVGFGGGDFGENNDLRSIGSVGMKALVSTLYLEYPNLKVRVLDFAQSTSAEEVSSKIIDELQTYDSFSAVGYDAQLSRRVIYYENSQPAGYKKRSIVWSKNDVVLVTGGAKGITAECALEFARSTKARMVMVGRSPVPKKSDDNSEILKTLEKFEKEGFQASYYQCDVTNPKDVVDVVSKIKSKVGKITGFVHGAGLNSLKRLKQSNVDEALVESLPKVIGAVNVCSALNGDLKFVAAITSIIGITGMEGSGWYGLANEVLNLYLHQYKSQNPKTEVVTIAYSIWDEVGMGTKLGSVSKLAERGIGAIPVKEGVSRFRQLVESASGTQQVMVAARVAGIDTLKTAVLKPNQFRFIEKVEYFMPGVELIAKAHLNIKDDPYLLDHNWKGSLLFPFVFGLEAMAQAVACVSGVEKFDSLKVKNIHLDRPISVPEEMGTSIELHVECLEYKSGLQEMMVEIYSQESAYIEPHFSAIFEINPKNLSLGGIDLEKNTTKVLDISPKTDLYGSILFQGGSFQCLDKIHELYFDDKKKEGECLFTAVFNSSALNFLGNNKEFNNKFLIGDPFFIDSVLQSMQLIVSQDSCLPNYVEEIEILTNQVGEGFKPVLSKIKLVDSEHYRGDAQGVNKVGNVIRIRNCTLKILESLPDNPKANDIVNPCERDQIILQDLIVKYERELGVKFPLITLNYISGLERLTKEERHEKERPFLNKAAQDFFKTSKKQINVKIKWDEKGKPILGTDQEYETHLSVTHEQNLILCSISEKEQSIDLETVSPRSSEEWLSLLGKEKYSLIKDFKGEDRDYLGTAVWTSNETIIKTSKDSKFQDFKIEKISEKNYYILRNMNDLFICLVVKLSRGNERLLTFLLKNQGVYQEPELNKQLGFENRYFHFNAEYTGPQEKLITSKKFPVVFKYSKTPSRRVNFSSYCEWIGEIREYSLLSVLKQLADVVETKEWGVATNNLILDINGELRGGDIVEGKVWMGNKINDNVYDLHFEFFKYVGDTDKELVALAFQRISWVKVLEHGKAKVNKLPLFLKEIMQKMEPRSGSPLNKEIFKELYPKGEYGQASLLQDYESKKILLFEMKIPTTLEESNLVGNIYFANYPIWVGRTTDSYFYKMWPDLFTSTDINNEFVCKRFKIDHLREAMPFDLINVKMYLGKLYSNGLTLNYEIYLNNGKKLAVAQQSLLWVKRGYSYAPTVTDLPRDMINRLIR